MLGEHLGQDRHEPANHGEPVHTAVKRVARLEQDLRRQLGHGLGAHVGQVREHKVERRFRGWNEICLAKAKSIRDGVPDGILSGEVERAGVVIGGEYVDVIKHPPRPKANGDRDGDCAASGPNVHDPDRRRTVRSRRRQEPGGDVGLGELDEPLRFWPRDQGTLIDGQCEPGELLQATQVGDRLTGFVAGDGGLEPGHLAVTDRGLGMGQHARPIDPEDVRQEQLRIQAC